MNLFKRSFFPFIAVLSILFFLSLFYAVRFEADDMVLSLAFRENSFRTVYDWYYQHFSFRPAVLFLVFATLGSDLPQIYPYTVFIYFSIIFVLWAWSIDQLLGHIFPWAGERKYFRLCFSVVQVTSIYFLCTNRIEVFGWATSSMLYLFPVVLSFYSASLLLKPAWSRINYLALLVCAILIAGSLEYVALLDLVLGASLILYHYRRQREMASGKEQLYRAIFFTVSLAVFTGLFITNPGLLKRARAAEDLVSLDHHTVPFLTMFFTPHKLIGIGLLLISWGFVIQARPSFKLESRILLPLSLCLLLAVAMILISSQLAYHSVTIGRMWFLADVLIYLLLSAIVLCFAPHLKVPARIFYAAAWLMTGVFSYYCVKHIAAQWTFVCRYDKVIEQVRKSSEQELLVIGLPKPDLGSSAALYQDPARPTNRLFCRFYKLPGAVIDTTAAGLSSGN